MGCTISTCNYVEPVIKHNYLNKQHELDLPVNNIKKGKNKIPHYKRQNSLTIDTSWGGVI